MRLWGNVLTNIYFEIINQVQRKKGDIVRFPVQLSLVKEKNNYQNFLTINLLNKYLNEK